MEVLIRDSAGEGNILRLKFPQRISAHQKGLIHLHNQGETVSLVDRIGSDAKTLVNQIFDEVPELWRISLRPKQIILNLGVGNYWSVDTENRVKAAVETIFRAWGETISWILQRRTGDVPRHL